MIIHWLLRKFSLSLLRVLMQVAVHWHIFRYNTQNHNITFIRIIHIVVLSRIGDAMSPWPSNSWATLLYRYVISCQNYPLFSSVKAQVCNAATLTAVLIFSHCHCKSCYVWLLCLFGLDIFTLGHFCEWSVSTNWYITIYSMCKGYSSGWNKQFTLSLRR